MTSMLPSPRYLFACCWENAGFEVFQEVFSFVAIFLGMKHACDEYSKSALQKKSATFTTAS